MLDENLISLPVISLPEGVYTFFLMATPADQPDPFLLWSTVYNHIEPIKGVFFNIEKESNWILTALDQNNLFYSLFGNKDADGSLQNFTQLVLDKQNGDSFAPYLTMQFDESGRPTSVLMPDSGGKMTLEYTSSTEVKVTVEADDGNRDSFVVDSPYDVQRGIGKSIVAGGKTTESSLMELSDSLRTYQRDSELDQHWSIGGTITGCKNNEVPSVQVKRELDAVILASAPQLALIKPTIATSEYLEDGQFRYYYYLQGLPDYDDWYWSCAWSYSGGVVTGLLGDTADKVLQLGESVIKDIKGDAGKNSVNFVIDNIGDAILPSWSFLRKLYNMGKLPIDIHNGPCSEKVYDFLNQVQTANETITVTLNGITKIKSFEPKPEWIEHFWAVDAPDFDFSDSCDEPVDPGSPGTCAAQGIPFDEVIVCFSENQWQQCGDGEGYTWDDANVYCSNLVLDGFSDWRLPTLKDFRDDGSCIREAFENSDFYDTYGYWTSDLSVSKPGKAMEYDFWGPNSYARLIESKYRVRCVR